MATVTNGTPGQPPVTGTASGAMSNQQIRETVEKFRQMKNSGTPATDPEFQAITQRMKMIQAQTAHMRNQQNYAHQMQQQKTANASQPNGHMADPSSQSTPTTNTATNPSPVGTAVDASKKGSQNANALFSPSQITMLKHQILAFKCLSKNMGVPIEVQQQLFPSQKSASILPQAPATAAALDNTLESKPAISTPGDGHVRRTMFESYISPATLLSASKGYKSLSSRVIIPSLSTPGIDLEKLKEERDLITLNRMSARYAELAQFTSNLAHVDVSRGGELVPEDTMKKRALIEMKKIELYAKQQNLRHKISSRLLSSNNLAMTANRTQYRRVKKQSLREARITEKLEKQQRDARQVREKKQHNDYITSVLEHRAQIANAAFAQKAKMTKFGRMIQTQHQSIEKEEQKRIERTAKQRLAALKSNDEEAYLKLLDQAKDTRITHLLKQTDGFLSQLAASVKAQQKKAAIKNAADDGRRHVVDEESEDDDEDDGDEPENSDVKKIDYYAVAHKIVEKVTKQADMLEGGTLKEYQIKGLEWMISLYNNNLNGILADEMGLGKTIQTISLITYLVEKKQQRGPFLVIVPLSTLTNWTLEFEKWAPRLNKIVYKGPPTSRKHHQQQIKEGRFNVLLTTYEYIIKDRPILSKIKWIHMIIDEGHRMKNAQSKLSGTLTTYYHTRYRLILTGTPLQNNLPELWALLNFVLPTIFKSVKSFDEWFNTPFANTGGQDKMELTEEEQILVIRRLHKVLRPFLLRRLKKDVEKDLPDKTEKVIKCKFSALQARLYKQMVTHNKLVVSDGKGGKTGARGLSNMIMQLRKLCNHPFVFDEVENEMNPTSTSNDLLWRTSGKFELLDRILPKYQATGHRVLMFFQMTAIMDIMEDFLRYRNIKFMRLDGTTKSDDRSDLLRDFNAPNSEYFIFLLSTRAGGLGLNLQTADTVIIYDSDWNPHQDLQAQDRAHRIGQKNEVRILRLITSSSVEEKILERAKFKLDMDGKVIQAGRFDNKSSESRAISDGPL